MTTNPRRWPRSILAVVAGLIAGAVLSLATDLALHAAGIFPALGERMDSQLLLLAAAYRGVYNVSGCYLAALLAPDRPMAHALVLGAIGLVLNAVGTGVMWDKGPAWYPLSGVVLALPYAWIGGRLRQRQTAAV